MSLLLRGKVSIKPALISSSIKRCFSSLQTSPSLPTNSNLSTSSPCLMLPPTLVANQDKGNSEMKPEDNNYYHFLNISDNKFVFKKKKKNIWLPWNNDQFSPDESTCIGSSHGWLAYIHPRNCALYLYNPFSDSSMPYLPLPPIETLRHIHSSRYIHSSRRLVNHSSSTSIVTDFMMRDERLDPIEYSTVSARELSKNFFTKVVMSGAGAPTDEYTDCTVMSSYRDVLLLNDDRQELAFCRIGDTSWTVLDSPSYSYTDIIYFSKENRFYAVSENRFYSISDTYGEDWIDIWDLTDPSSPKRYDTCYHQPCYWSLPITDQQEKVREGCYRTFYLVESSEELLTVVRYYMYSHGKLVTKAFDVFKLEHPKDCIYVPNIGDLVLFVGGYQSFCLSTLDFPRLRKNCIYFIAENELGVYNLEDDRMEYSFDLEETEPSPVWVIPHH